MPPQAAICGLFFFLTVQLITHAQVNVTTYHNDNARTGQNTQETVLTTSKVGSSGFGPLFSVTVDGQVYAQPLVLSNVSIGGGTHNVVYVATENDSVYAIDANNGTVYWRESLLGPGETTYPNSGCSVIQPIGITSTPVIDPATGTIYVVAKSAGAGSYYYRLHALDTSTSNEKFGGPSVIAATIGIETFAAKVHLNRSALLLENGDVLMGFGSTGCDIISGEVYYGWVFAYSASNLAQNPAVFPVVPNGIQGAVWMSGNGAASDAGGNLFFATGNGTYDGPLYSDYANSILRLSPPIGTSFSVADWFTPYDWKDLSDNDLDVGAGGVLLLPDQSVGPPHLLVQAGKNGTIYLVNRDSMGKNCGTPPCVDNIVQELPGALVGVWGSPAYWNGYVYFGSALDSPATADSMKAYSVNAGGSGPLSGPTSVTPEKFAWPGPTASVSSNGISNGILWVLDNSSYRSSCCQVLHAYSATNLGSELYSIKLPFAGIKFSVPTVANGEVFVGSNGALTAFGVTSGPTNTLSPTSLYFGAPVGCTSGPVPVTLKNTGSVWMNVYSAVASGSGFSANMGTCTTFLNPGQSCEVNVTYTGVLGGSTGKLYVWDSGANSPQTASLTGISKGICQQP